METYPEEADREIIDFATDYCDFTNPNHVWMMQLISRKKDNPSNWHNIFRRFVLTKKEDIADSYAELKLFCIDPNTTYRVYLSLNARDVISASNHFAQSIISMNYSIFNGNAEMLPRMKNLSSEWKTELCQKRNRGTKRLLIDVDNPQYLQSVIFDIRSNIPLVDIYAISKTPNGYAVVINACDIRFITNKYDERDVSIHRDSLLFLSMFKGNGFVAL